MKDKKVLNNEELEKVNGGADTNLGGSYSNGTSMWATRQEETKEEKLAQVNGGFALPQSAYIDDPSGYQISERMRVR